MYNVDNTLKGGEIMFDALGIISFLIIIVCVVMLISSIFSRRVNRKLWIMIVIGSLVGFLLGELSNAWLMERIKRGTKGRFLWVRTIGSSVVGYMFDTIPFVLIAFLGTLTVRDLLLMIALQYLMKLGIEAFFGTPMAYAAISLLRKMNVRLG